MREEDLLLLGSFFEKFFGFGFRPAGGCGRNAGRKFFWFFGGGYGKNCVHFCLKNVNIETMENQEIPKKLTPEEIEQQKKNLEQQEETKENPVEEDSTVRLSDINENITKKEENIQNTQNKINDIRGQLGLPPSEEVPPSIKNDQDSIGKLNQEKSQIEDKIKEVESRAKNMTTNEGEKFSVLTDSNDIQEYKELKKQLGDIEGKNTNETTEKSEETKRFEKNFKTVLEDISTQSKTMFDALYERQQERLTPLQSNDNFQMMVSNVRNLKNFEGKIDADSISKITEDINKLSRLFDDIKVQPVGGQMRENSQNLEKLVFGAKKFSTSLEESKHKIPIEMGDKVMEEKSRELRKSIQRLSEQAQKMWLFANKLRSN